MKAFVAADIEYSKEDSIALRGIVIKIRDAELSKGEVPNFERAVELSHVIAWMGAAIDRVYTDEAPASPAPAGRHFTEMQP